MSPELLEKLKTDDVLRKRLAELMVSERDPLSKWNDPEAVAF